MPDLPARPGTVLLEARDVEVAGRLGRPVSLALGSGARLVVAGPNGAGESTPLAVLAGDLAPTGGRVRRAPGTRTSLLRQESPRAGTRAAAEVLAAHLARTRGAGDPSPADLAPADLGLLRPAELDRPVRELSAGRERTSAGATWLRRSSGGGGQGGS